MQSSQNLTPQLPYTNLRTSYSEASRDITEGIQYKTDTLESSTNHPGTVLDIDKPIQYQSADTSDDEPFTQRILNRTRSANTRHHHSHSDLSLLINKSRSFDTANQKQSLDTLSHDDLRSEYVKERKQRIRQRRKYKHLSQQFKETLTKKADEYEDELQLNEDALKQEYEAKLIQAEIQRNASEMKVTQLTQEVERLNQLLNKSYPTPTHSNISLLSMSVAETATAKSSMSNIAIHRKGPLTAASISYPLITHRRNYSNSNPIPQIPYNNMTPIDAVNGFSFSILPGTKEDEGMTFCAADSMQRKLKEVMSPAIRINPEHIGSFNQRIPVENNEGTDDEMEKHTVYTDNYSTNTSNTYSDSQESETPPPRRKRRKRKKRKKKKDTFWDYMVRCFTPSVCEDNV